MVQYCADKGFNTKTLNMWVRKTYGHSKSQVNFRLSEDGEELSGFKRNGLSPYGNKAVDVPVVMDSAILKEEDVWVGGGEYDVKISVSSADLRDSLKAVVLDLSK